MRIILAGIFLSVLIAAAVGYGLFSTQKPIYEAFARPSVRLGREAGDNLVGPDWSGLYKTTPQQARTPQPSSIVVGED